MVLIIFINIVFAFIFAQIGAKRTIGYWSAFFASLLLTPIIGAILILSSDKLYYFKCPSCGHQINSTNMVAPKSCPVCGYE